jgi:hypothetical protein
MTSDDAMLVRGPARCVACGKPVALTGDGYANHHCPPQSESAKKSANTRAHDGYSRTPPLWERLNDGFLMLKEDDDE